MGNLETWLLDLRTSLRQLAKSPVFTATIVLTLALGIGANTAIYTLVRGILLRSLPVANPNELYRIGDTDNCCINGGIPGDNGDFDIFSYALYQHFRDNTPEFVSLAAAQAGWGLWSVRRGGQPARSVRGELVSGNYFSTFGVRPYAGRLLQDSDDTPAAEPVAVMSYRAWQTDFNADRGILGATLSIQAHPYTVIGIAPPGFFGDRVSENPPELFLPLAAQPTMFGQTPDTSLLHLPDSNWLYPIGRVRPGTSIPALQAKLSASLRNWLYSRPTYTANGGASVIPRQHVAVVPAGGGVQRMQLEIGAGLRMLMLLAGVVLALACANIANVMLARSTTHRAEIALRVALGEGRGRLMRRILTESALLGCIGGLLGLAVAYLGANRILALAFPMARLSSIQATPTWPVLLFALLLSLAAGILFGMAPAWMATRAQPADALRGVRTVRDRSSLPQSLLVVCQVALSLVLLGGALLMTRSLKNLEQQNFGVVIPNRYVLHFDPAGAGYSNARLPALYRQIEDRFAALPGAAHVSLSLYSPLEGDNWGECVIQQGHPAPGPNAHCGASWDRVSPDFLASVGVPMVRGRDLSPRDTATSQPVAVVNQTFVKRFFPNTDPIGQHFGLDYPEYSGSFEIVGVFRDFKLNNPRDVVRPVFLRPLSQYYTGYQRANMKSVEDGSMVIRALVMDFSHPPADAGALLRQTLAGVDPNLTVQDLNTFGEQVAQNFTEERLVANLTGLFGLLALILASVGLYGVTAYLVARRTGEIGVRMALGATRPGIVRMVLRGVVLQAGAGLLVGIPAAYFATRFMASQLYKVGVFDTTSWLGAAAALLACALLAGFIPARRAASIDPIQTLRAE